MQQKRKTVTLDDKESYTETLTGGVETGNYGRSCAFDQSSGTRQRKVDE